MTDIKSSIIYVNIHSLVPNLSVDKKLFLSSYMGLGFSLAMIDGKIFKSELQIIIDSIPKSIDLNELQKESLVELNLAQINSDKELMSMVPTYIKYISNFLSYKNRLKVLKTLYRIAFSDGDFSEHEAKLINLIAIKFNVYAEDLEEVKQQVETNLESEGKDELITNVLKLPKKVTQIKRKISFEFLDTDTIYKLGKSLNNSQLLFFVKRICSHNDLKSEDHLLITAYLGCLFIIAYSDGLIHENEMLYIKKEFAKLYSLDDESMKALIDLNIYVIEKEAKHSTSFLNGNKELKNVYSNYIDILKKSLMPSDANQFLLTCFNVANADGNVLKVEIEAINFLINQFEISEVILNDIKARVAPLTGSMDEVQASQNWEV